MKRNDIFRLLILQVEDFRFLRVPLCVVHTYLRVSSRNIYRVNCNSSLWLVKCLKDEKCNALYFLTKKGMRKVLSLQTTRFCIGSGVYVCTFYKYILTYIV